MLCEINHDTSVLIILSTDNIILISVFPFRSYTPDWTSSFQVSSVFPSDPLESPNSSEHPTNIKMSN